MNAVQHVIKPNKSRNAKKKELKLSVSFLMLVACKDVESLAIAKEESVVGNVCFSVNGSTRAASLSLSKLCDMEFKDLAEETYKCVHEILSYSRKYTFSHSSKKCRWVKILAEDKRVVSKKIRKDYSYSNKLKDESSLSVAYNNEIGSKEYGREVEMPPYNYYFKELDLSDILEEAMMKQEFPQLCCHLKRLFITDHRNLSV
uniref:FERM domain-containing protein n=1 Tax=Rhabditophanes sp. KR3021 TaxID=114890 RepID=A0AC35U348_9BILA